MSRDARGLAIVLLYASYEHLLKDITRELLTSASRLRAGNRRLKTGLQVFAIYERLNAVSDAPSTASIWTKHGRQVVETLSKTQGLTINPYTFPSDGSRMRNDQVLTICQLLDLGDPMPILKDIWIRIDTIVTERNAVAHGSETADQVGRRYSATEIADLVDGWERSWLAFIDWVEGQATTSAFFLRPR